MSDSLLHLQAVVKTLNLISSSCLAEHNKEMYDKCVPMSNAIIFHLGTDNILVLMLPKP